MRPRTIAAVALIASTVSMSCQSKVMLETDLIAQMAINENNPSASIIACTGVGEETQYDVSLMKSDNRYITVMNVTDMTHTIQYALNQSEMHDKFIRLINRAYNIISSDLFTHIDVRIGKIAGDWYTADVRTRGDNFELRLTLEDESATLITSKVQVEDLSECLNRVNRTMQTYYTRY